VAAFQVLQQIAAHLASQPGGPEARLPAGHAVDRYSPALILLWTITESRRLRASAISEFPDRSHRELQVGSAWPKGQMSQLEIP